MARSSMLLLFALAGLANSDQGYDAPPPPPPPGYSYGTTDLRAEESVFDLQEEDPLARLALSIPRGGIPGENYPVLSFIPSTGFSCLDQDYPGYFADTAPEAGCQVFHICQFDGRQDSFLCPNGTIFNQQYFICDWWFNVDCTSSQQFLRLNEDIGKVPEVEAEASLRADVLEEPQQFYATPSFREATLPTPTEPNNLYSIPNIF